MTLSALIYVAATIGLVLLLDQWSKRLVRDHVPHGHVPLGLGLRIRCVTVRRQAYGRPSSRAALIVIWCLALAAAILLALPGQGFDRGLAPWGLGAALGGAAGNLLDILRRRAVLDFIDLGWWPAFNLADVGIIAGLVVTFWPWTS